MALEPNLFAYRREMMHTLQVLEQQDCDRCQIEGNLFRVSTRRRGLPLFTIKEDDE